MSGGKSHPPCPLPLTLQHRLTAPPPPPCRCPHSQRLLFPFHTHCVTLSILAYLVPAVLEATRSLGQAAARVGQLDWGGGAWGEGGEQGRGCGQCYFERLAEQHP